MRTSLFATTLTTVFGLACLFASSAAAQQEPDIDIQTFRPIAGPHGIYSVEGARTVGHLKPVFGLMLNYSSEPLVRGDGADAVSVVNQQLASHLQAGIGLSERFQLDLSMPLYLVNDVRWQGNSYNGFTTGDMSTRGKLRILSSQNSPLGLGVIAEVRLPTGDTERFTGTGGVSVTPKVIVDSQIGPVYLAANLGTPIQREQQVGNLSPGSGFVYKVGAEVSFIEGLLSVGGEVFGGTEFDEFFADYKSSPLEGLLGVKLRTPSGFAVATGAGGGLVPGAGAPSFRSFIGVSWNLEDKPVEEAPPSDIDGDGILDEVDQCPAEPEDFDGFEDEDGCPDYDNDGDGVLDANDKCPMVPGPPGFNGCPRTDTDGDGVFDDEDRCIDVPGPRENQGCPWGDKDKDGVLDNVDACPDEPGIPELKGCPKPSRVNISVELKQIVITDNVYFETDKAKIQPISYSLLDEIAEVLQENEDIRKVEVAGHTDKRGTAKHNKKLSQDRAQSVIEYLVKKGVARERLVAQGYGYDKPLVPDETKENRERNRRVEFHILEQDEPTPTTTETPEP